MPRQFVDDRASEIVRINQQDFDVNDIVSGYDQGLDDNTRKNNNLEVQDD